jgi:hypothetical protein
VEKRVIFDAHMEYGNKWVEISKKLPGRYYCDLAVGLTMMSRMSIIQYLKRK